MPPRGPEIFTPGPPASRSAFSRRFRGGSVSPPGRISLLPWRAGGQALDWVVAGTREPVLPTPTPPHTHLPPPPPAPVPHLPPCTQSRCAVLRGALPCRAVLHCRVLLYRSRARAALCCVVVCCCIVEGWRARARRTEEAEAGHRHAHDPPRDRACRSERYYIYYYTLLCARQ